MTAIPRFFDSELADPLATENFRKLREFLVSESPWLGFRFYEVSFDKAQVNSDFIHNLGFQPSDAVITSITGGATASFNYDKFNSQTVQVSVSKACVLRFMLGTMTGAKS